MADPLRGLNVVQELPFKEKPRGKFIGTESESVNPREDV